MKEQLAEIISKNVEGLSAEDILGLLEVPPKPELLQILDEAKQARADGSIVNIAIMKKNKKFQKEQMQAEGYEEFREFFIDRM